METKVLLRLIKDDIKLLDEINASFMSDEKLSPDEVEVALTRARSLVMEFEMLSRNVGQVHEIVVRPDESVQDEGNKTGEDTDLMEADSELIDLEEEEVSKPKDEEPILKTGIVEHDVDAKQMHEEKAEKIEKSPTPAKVLIQGELFEEVGQKDRTEVGDIFGDNHQMVHGPAAEKNKRSFEVPPLKSIRDGIGINDRFLFIRELFGNDLEKYEATIAALDSFNRIEEAVSYLKQNFKWNKSEAGQKFLNLVKRRFRQ
jgi:hypothetical protein